MSNSFSVNKSSLRARYLGEREKLPADYRKEAAAALAHHLLSAVPIGAEIVAGYLSMRGEIDIYPAMEKLAERGHALCLPVIVEKDRPLAFRRWHPGAPLEKGMHGTEIPLSTEPPVIPDVVVVPLVAFDAACHRLGYGAGYYDRTLAELRRGKTKILAVGAAYARQKTAHIQAEDNDEKLDMIVTEKGVIMP